MIDWQVFLDAYRPVREAVERHRWIYQWVQAGPGRSARVTLSFSPPDDHPGRNLDWDTTFPLLRREGGQPIVGERRFHVELLCADQVGARLWLALGDRRVLITEAGGCHSEHFLDQQRPWSAPLWGFQYTLFLDYIAVEPDGRWFRNTRKKRQDRSRRRQL